MRGEIEKDKKEEIKETKKFEYFKKFEKNKKKLFYFTVRSFRWCVKKKDLHFNRMGPFPFSDFDFTFDHVHLVGVNLFPINC